MPKQHSEHNIFDIESEYNVVKAIHVHKHYRPLNWKIHSLTVR